MRYIYHKKGLTNVKPFLMVGYLQIYSEIVENVNFS